MAMEALRIAAKESKFMKFILGGFIFLAVGGLVFTDINGYFRGGLPNTTVARVGDTEINIRDFDQDLRQFLTQTRMTPEEAYDAGIINAYLQNRIDSILALKDAQDLNIVVGDSLIAQQVKATFPNASKDQIQASLRARGMSEGQMAYILSQEVQSDIVSRLPKIIKTYPATSLAEPLNRYDAERRSGVVYSFPANKLTDSIKISETDIENQYNAVKAFQYAIPETRIFTIGTLTIEDAKKNLPPITDEDVRADYDDRQSDFITPEKRALAQAVVNDPDQAQAIYEKASKGMNLRDALKEAAGDDSGFRDVAEYEQNGLPEDLSAAVFTDGVKSGDVLPPVKTLLGWTVIKVTAIAPESQKSFASVKDDVKKEMESARTYDALYNKMVDTETLLDNGSSFDDIANKVAFKTQKTKALSKTVNPDDLPDELKAAMEVSSSVMDEIFNLPLGGASYPIETGDDRFIVVGVETINEASFMPLESVRGNIESALKSNQINAKATQEIDGIVAQLNDKTASIDDIAKKYGAKKQSFNAIGRDDKKFDAALIFDAKKGAYNSAIIGGNVMVSMVNAISFDKTEKTDEAEKNDFSSLIDSLLRTFRHDSVEITINDGLLKSQYRPDNS